MTVDDSRPVFFFDIDNCLYSRNSKVHTEAQRLINKFISTHLSLDADDAAALHTRYLDEYGLALEGLARNHKIAPLDFNREVDDALPLESLLKPNPELRDLLTDIDKSKVKLWLLTNAYETHGRRVVRILGIDHLFEGITFCDYSRIPLICKPAQEMFAKAEQDAGAPSSASCYFIDDSHLNCVHALKRGWTVVHLAEPGHAKPDGGGGGGPEVKHTVGDIRELRTLFPELFKSDGKSLPN